MNDFDTNELTELRARVASQAEELRLLRALIDGLPDPVYLKDREGRYLLQNEATCRVVGRSAAELHGRDDRAIFPAAEAERIMAGDRDVLEGGVATTYEELATDETGSRRTYLSTKGPVRDARGEVIALFGIARDVTARKAAQQALDEREQRHARLFEAMPTGVVIQAPDGRIIDANPAAEEILGLSLDQMQGRRSVDPSWRAIHEDGTPFPGETHPAMVTLATGQPVKNSVMGVFHPSEGRHRWILVSSTPLFREGEPSPYCVFTTYADVTAQRLAQEALREKEELLSLALAVGKIGVFEVDLESGRGAWSPAIADLWGIDEGYAGKFADLCWSRLHPEDLAKTTAAFEAMIAGGDVREMGFRIVRPDGEQRWVSWLGQVVTDPTSGARRAVGVNLDVTGPRLDEERIRRRVEELEALMELAPTAIYFSSDAECREVVANRAAKRLYDDPTEAGVATGAKAIEDVTPRRYFREGRELSLEELPLQRAAAHGTSVHEFEFECEMVSGRRVAVQGSAAPLRDADAKLRGSVAVLSNVTQQRRAEEARRALDQRLQQAQRLESLGVLAGGIAHDFNNILMGIMGNAELCLEATPAQASAREFLGEVKRSSRRAAELCKQLLAYSGKGRFEKRAIEVTELVEETLEMLKASISKKCVLNLRLERQLPAIEADSSQIRQVLMNLVINASEAIGDRSGVLTVTTGALECSAEYLLDGYLVDPPAPGLYVTLEVSDTGCGMDRATVQRMFEPFFTTKFTGRGLGLAAVLGIVRGHGGALRVYTEPGKGTTMKVLLPASPLAVRAEQARDPKPPWRGRGTVLLADDEETVRAITARLLRQLGLEVITAEDGREALAIYRARGAEIDLVLLDLTMPHMGGEDASREIRLIEPEAKIVLASGWDERDFGPRFAGKRLSGFLQKPYSLQRLRELLSSLLPEAAPAPRG